eukprot:TRINITY_DN19652_c0_g1_i1.p1 TRINITY_DN19652_c0_g1~~TRINITY_DN19652_c0_g1_i1.p1  ORF type:complete len:305 (-),score=72.14 TRINITY_DN19652_c0_g1_i1:120-959(-)
MAPLGSSRGAYRLGTGKEVEGSGRARTQLPPKAQRVFPVGAHHAPLLAAGTATVKSGTAMDSKVMFVAKAAERQEPAKALIDEEATSTDELAVLQAALPRVMAVLVRRQREIKPMLIELDEGSTVADLKLAIAQAGRVPAEDQRLFVQSRRLYDDQALKDVLDRRKPEVMLVPKLQHRAAQGVDSICARRGFIMLPDGPRPWKPDRNALVQSEDVRQFHGERRENANLMLEALPHLKDIAPAMSSLLDEMDALEENPQTQTLSLKDVPQVSFSARSTAR